MKVCVVGSGGREHALASVMSMHNDDVVVSGGNPGISNSVPDAPTDIDADLFVIGPEQPLVDGLGDELRAQGKRVFGPGADGAKLEGSKAWMKDLLVDAAVPTARHGSFDDAENAIAFLSEMTEPFVVKTDGLAGGKGVLVTESRTEAEQAVRDYLSGSAFGAAGQNVVIEEGLVGPEVSVIAVCDGKSAVPLAPAQDHKRLLDGDDGPNTGGMGAFSPIPSIGHDVVDVVMDTCVEPTLAALRRKGIDYRGILYAGLMMTPNGIRVLEYNVRFGDPECQVVVPRLTSELSQLLAEAADGKIRSEPTFSTNSMVGIVAASHGYPTNPEVGDVIVGLEEAQALDDARVFCAGVGQDNSGRLVTAGGRVLTVCGEGETLAAAHSVASDALARISWRGLQHRTDIASEAAKEQS